MGLEAGALAGTTGALVLAGALLTPHPWSLPVRGLGGVGSAWSPSLRVSCWQLVGSLIIVLITKRKCTFSYVLHIRAQ